MTDDVKEKRNALAYKRANNWVNHNESCPRGVSNPGIWFGFIEGFSAGWMLEQTKIKELVQEIEILKSELIEAQNINKGKK